MRVLACGFGAGGARSFLGKGLVGLESWGFFWGKGWGGGVYRLSGRRCLGGRWSDMPGGVSGWDFVLLKGERLTGMLELGDRCS